MRVLRTKDGGVGNVDRHSKKLVSRNAEEFDKNLEILLKDIQPNERIYSTVDARDTSKAIRTFKELQLANDYTPNPEDFYLDIYNRWISSLQQLSARKTRLFLFDCDSPDEYDRMQNILYNIESCPIVHRYETKNGGHIITGSFEYPKFLHSDFHHLKFINAMMLWVY